MTANSNNCIPSASTNSSTYSVKEIAVILGISKKSAYTLCEQNYFISKRIGRIIRINKISFDEWLNSRPE